jgi:hypothetical protein
MKLLLSASTVLCISIICGCQQTKDALGISRHQPDEFSVLTRDTLRAPKSASMAAPSKNQYYPFAMTPEKKAMAALGFSVTSAPLSANDQEFIKSVSMKGCDPNVRALIAQDMKGTSSSNMDPWAAKMFSWHKDREDKKEAIDPNHEYERLYNQKKIQSHDVIKERSR